MNRESELLKKWTVDASVPTSFNASVWRRIEERRRFSVGEAVRVWMNDLFARRAVALAYLSVAVFFGLAAAQVQSSRVLHQRESRLEARYIQSVDPYAARATP